MKKVVAHPPDNLRSVRISSILFEPSIIHEAAQIPGERSLPSLGRQNRQESRSPPLHPNRKKLFRHGAADKSSQHLLCVRGTTMRGRDWSVRPDLWDLASRPDRSMPANPRNSGRKVDTTPAPRRRRIERWTIHYRGSSGVEGTRRTFSPLPPLLSSVPNGSTPRAVGSVRSDRSDLP